MPKLTVEQHQNLSFWGMAFIAIGLPLSVFLVSVGTFILSVNWLLERNYLQRLKQFFTDPLSVIIVSIYGLYVGAMLYTENVPQGLKELRIKLPILLLPLLLFTSKMPSRKRLQDVLLLFVLGCVIGTILGIIHFVGVTGADVIEKRDLSVIISHIRFGLMLTLSIFVLAFYIVEKRKIWSPVETIVAFATAAWLLFFMVFMEVGTGYLAFAILAGLSLLRLLIKAGSYKIKVTVAATIIIGLVAGVFFTNRLHHDHKFEIPITQATLNVKTLNGNYYAHQKDVPYRENGHRVWNFVCDEELEKEWANYSTIGFNGTDHRGQPIRFTLIRYLTSKGLKKDSVGLSLLTDTDITNVERGFTNFKRTSKWDLSRRLSQFFWEIESYEVTSNPSNSSLLLRWVYFKMGLSILKENPLFGVGTGDIRLAYNQIYANDNQGLDDKIRGISHNQFLSAGVALGALGMGWFIFAFFYPLRFYYKDYLYLMFIALILTSFLTDNTLDSQSGATLFAFFNAFLIARKEFSVDI